LTLIFVPIAAHAQMHVPQEQSNRHKRGIWGFKEIFSILKPQIFILQLVFFFYFEFSQILKLSQNPFLQVLLFAGCIIGSLSLVTFLGAAAAPCFGFSFSEVVTGSNEPSLGVTRYVLFLQSLGIFLLPAYFAMRFQHKNALTRLGVTQGVHPVNIINVIAIALTALPFISFVADLNAQLPLPQWAIDMETQSALLVEQLLFTENISSLLLNLLVIAVTPAIAEELFFRGFLQSWFEKNTKNIHVAILITAAIFSAMHLQFAGFIPRLLLGLVFGYLFYWSKSIWLPIVAHFANNAVTVCVYFYIFYCDLPIDMDDIDSVMQDGMWMPLLSVCTAGFLLWSMYNSLKRK
jgi:membrane protease YdiL (CAAX protease family)